MPEASFQDLQMALHGFNNALKDYSVNSAVQSATEKVRQLNQAGLDEAQRRQQADLLARDLALQLTGVGASGQQVQSAFSAIAPPDIKNYAEMYGQGVQAGSQPMIEQATKWRDFMNEDKFKLAQIKADQAMQAASLKFAQRSSLAGSQAFNSALTKSQEGYNREVKSFLDKAAQIDTVLSLPTSTISDRINLTTLVKAVGQDVGNIGEKEAEAALGPTLYGKLKAYQNFAFNEADSVMAKRQAEEIKKVMTMARQKLYEAGQGRLKKYSYQLQQKAKVLGSPISHEEAASLLDMQSGQAAPNTAAPASNSMDAFLTITGK